MVILNTTTFSNYFTTNIVLFKLLVATLGSLSSINGIKIGMYDHSGRLDKAGPISGRVTKSKKPSLGIGDLVTLNLDDSKFINKWNKDGNQVKKNSKYKFKKSNDINKPVTVKATIVTVFGSGNVERNEKGSPYTYAIELVDYNDKRFRVNDLSMTNFDWMVPTTILRRWYKSDCAETIPFREYIENEIKQKENEIKKKKNEIEKIQNLKRRGSGPVSTFIQEEAILKLEKKIEKLKKPHLKVTADQIELDATVAKEREEEKRRRVQEEILENQKFGNIDNNTFNIDKGDIDTSIIPVQQERPSASSTESPPSSDRDSSVSDDNGGSLSDSDNTGSTRAPYSRNPEGQNLKNSNSSTVIDDYYVILPDSEKMILDEILQKKGLDDIYELDPNYSWARVMLERFGSRNKIIGTNTAALDESSSNIINSDHIPLDQWKELEKYFNENILSDSGKLNNMVRNSNFKNSKAIKDIIKNYMIGYLKSSGIEDKINRLEREIREKKELNQEDYDWGRKYGLDMKDESYNKSFSGEVVKEALQELGLYSESNQDDIQFMRGIVEIFELMPNKIRPSESQCQTPLHSSRSGVTTVSATKKSDPIEENARKMNNTELSFDKIFDGFLGSLLIWLRNSISTAPYTNSTFSWYFRSERDFLNKALYAMDPEKYFDPNKAFDIFQDLEEKRILKSDERRRKSEIRRNGGVTHDDDDNQTDPSLVDFEIDPEKLSNACEKYQMIQKQTQQPSTFNKAESDARGYALCIGGLLRETAKSDYSDNPDYHSDGTSRYQESLSQINNHDVFEKVWKEILLSSFLAKDKELNPTKYENPLDNMDLRTERKHLKMTAKEEKEKLEKQQKMIENIIENPQRFLLDDEMSSIIENEDSIRIQTEINRRLFIEYIKTIGFTRRAGHRLGGQSALNIAFSAKVDDYDRSNIKLNFSNISSSVNDSTILNKSVDRSIIDPNDNPLTLFGQIKHYNNLVIYKESGSVKFPDNPFSDDDNLFVKFALGSSLINSDATAKAHNHNEITSTNWKLSDALLVLNTERYYKSSKYSDRKGLYWLLEVSRSEGLENEISESPYNFFKPISGKRFKKLHKDILSQA